MPRNAKRANRPNPRIDRNPLPPTELEHRRIKRVELIPRNLAQERYVDALQGASNHMVFAIGPAGCGKTLLATQYAIQQLQQRQIERIVITRPAVSNGEDLGALPGNLIEKMAPWTRPLIDIFREYYTVRTIAHLLAEEIIEICPLGFMRGRTFKDSVVIFDEAQNSLPSQMQMCLTRIGDRSRMFITGDLQQHDRGYEDNGLQDFIDRLDRQQCRGISVCRFDTHDVERHPIIEDVLRIYDERRHLNRRWNGSSELSATAD